MKKNIFNPVYADEIIARAQALTPASKALWGNMNINTMLFHCNKVNRDIMKGKPADKKPALKQRLLKLMLFKVMKNFPKGIQSNPKYVNTKDYNLGFEKDLADYIEIISLLANGRQNIKAAHPMLGNLTNAEWGVFIWKHMDHHLKQFGV